MSDYNDIIPINKWEELDRQSSPSNTSEEQAIPIVWYNPRTMEIKESINGGFAIMDHSEWKRVKLVPVS